MESIVYSQGISLLLVLSEGLLSFFSPCILPLIPVYMSYLAGNAKQTMEDGTILYNRKKVFLHTLCFVLGISFAFFILGMSFTALGKFFQDKQLLFTRIGGILILVLGLYQIGIFDFKFLQRERKLKLNFSKWEMNPLVACVMGFTFSFAWTPCVGPALSSVLILASSASSSTVGILLIFLYTLGFTLPFLLLGLFTTQVLSFLKKHKKILTYSVKVGGFILIVIGIMTFTGWMNGISKYLTLISPVGQTNTEQKESTDDAAPSNEDVDASDSGSSSNDKGTSDANNSSSPDSSSNSASESTERPVIAAPDFTLTDQYGNVHTLSDYKGKIIFLNFWATWCYPCQVEMPDIEALYQEYGLNSEDVVILGVANPSTDEHPNNNDVSIEEITAFLEESDLTFPTVFDDTGEVFRNFYVSGFPTSYFIDVEGNIYGHASGTITKSIMENAIQQTRDSVPAK